MVYMQEVEVTLPKLQGTKVAFLSLKLKEILNSCVVNCSTAITTQEIAYIECNRHSEINAPVITDDPLPTGSADDSSGVADVGVVCKDEVGVVCWAKLRLGVTGAGDTMVGVVCTLVVGVVFGGVATAAAATVGGYTLICSWELTLD